MVFPFLLIIEVQRAAPLPVGETGVASGKGLRRDPKRNKIAAFGNFVFVLGGSPLQRARAAPLATWPRLRPHNSA